MMNKTFVLLTLIGILILSVSCSSLSYDTKQMPETQTQISTDIQDGQGDFVPHDTAFRSNSFLLQMDDLKAINMATNYLKEMGESVAFQETYIEYHDAGEYAANISLADGISVDYLGNYLEVRLYQSDNPEQNPCEHGTVVYISQDGKILGQNNIFRDTPIQEDAVE